MSVVIRGVLVMKIVWSVSCFRFLLLVLPMMGVEEPRGVPGGGLLLAL